MLVTSTHLVLHAAHGLRAEDIPTEQTNAGIGQFLLRIRAPPPVGFFNQAVVILRQADEFEDCWVGKTWQLSITTAAS